MEESQQSGNKYSILLCTTNSVDEASSLAEHLVGNHLVACVNIIPVIRSVYWWQEKVNHDNEVLMLMKTQTVNIPAIEKAIRLLHSYQTPELIALPVEFGITEYLKWIDASLAERTNPAS